MSEKNKTLFRVCSAFISICVIGAWGAHCLDQSSPLVWYSILPPLLAIACVILTRRLLLSLGLAVAIGIFLSSIQSHPESLRTWAPSLFLHTASVTKSVANSFNLLVIIFIALTLSMISVVIVSGGMQAVIKQLERFAKGPRSTQLATALAGLAVFIDDYANAMIVGSTMRPVTDRHRISREKLAFLVDSTTAPIAGLALVSTWISYEVGLFNDVADTLELARDGYSMFFDALGFRFYCMITIIFVLVNVTSGTDYGTMRKAQERARNTGEVIAADARLTASKFFTKLAPSSVAVAHPLTAVVPIAALLLVMFVGFWIDGDGKGSVLSPYAWREALSNANTLKILTLASANSFLLAIACAKLLSRISFSEISVGVISGFKGCALPTAILILAWGLKAVCDQLSTGNFLAAAMEGAVSPQWFPALLFIIASITSFATGTSWGTMAILIPIAIPMAFALDDGRYGLTTMISLGAVLDGSIFGDHCSPISDTTIMSSIASECDPIHHIRTQLPYSLTIAGFALVFGYIPAALGVPAYIGLGLSGVLLSLLFFVIFKVPVCNQTAL